MGVEDARIWVVKLDARTIQGCCLDLRRRLVLVSFLYWMT